MTKTTQKYPQKCSKGHEFAKFSWKISKMAQKLEFLEGILIYKFRISEFLSFRSISTRFLALSFQIFWQKKPGYNYVLWISEHHEIDNHVNFCVIWIVLWYMIYNTVSITQNFVGKMGYTNYCVMMLCYITQNFTW